MGGTTAGRIALLTFAAAILIRVALILASPRVNVQNSDLESYRMIGRLVHARVDAYDPRDGIGLRAALRQQTRSATVSITQAHWDYTVGSLLPLNFVVLGAVESVSPAPRWYRVAFALADSVFAVLAMVFVLRHWPGVSRLEALVCGALLGAGSLVMFQWGTHSPQDKGIELALMTGALVALGSRRTSLAVVVGGLLLGLSVAFKAVGICLVPLFFLRIWTRTKPRLLPVLVLAAVSGSAALAWHLPYLRDSSSMMDKRLGDDLDLPRHASPFTWVSAADYYVTNYYDVIERARYARIAIGGVLVAAALLALWRRRIGVETATAALLMLFVAVILIAGGVDRMNIGIVTAILLIGVAHPRARRVAVGLYVLLGLVSVTLGFRLSLIEERVEGFVVGIGLLALVAFVVARAVSSRRSSEAANRLGNSALGADPWLVPAAAAVWIILAAAVVATRPLPGRVVLPPPPAEWPLNPFVGAWTLNVAQTRAQSGRFPVRLLIQNRGAGFVASTDPQLLGPIRGPERPIGFDGMAYPSPLRTNGYGTMRFDRVNEYILDFTEEADATVLKGTVSASTDSKTMTITYGPARAGGDIVVYGKG